MRNHYDVIFFAHARLLQKLFSQRCVILQVAILGAAGMHCRNLITETVNVSVRGAVSQSRGKELSQDNLSASATSQSKKQKKPMSIELENSKV